jgi:hypothetical protein
VRRTLWLGLWCGLFCVFLRAPIRAQSVSDSDFFWISPYAIYVYPYSADTTFDLAVWSYTATPLAELSLPITFAGVAELTIDTTVHTPPDIRGVTYGPSGSDPAWTVRTVVVDNSAKTILLAFASFGVPPPDLRDTLCYLHFHLAPADQFVVQVETTTVGSSRFRILDPSGGYHVPTWTPGYIASLWDRVQEDPIRPRRGDLMLMASPNPCNAGTRLEFGLERADRVRLAVVNLLGQEIALLVDTDLPAGQHRVQWNGRADHGGEVASGVYFGRLQVGSRLRSTRALTVLR